MKKLNLSNSKNTKEELLVFFKYGLNQINNMLMNTLNKMNINMLQFLSCT